jgi:hypothetical protein
MDAHVSGVEVVTAEVLWAVMCVSSHYSYNSCTNIGSFVRRAFHDSMIAKKFSCGENKVAYLVGFGLGPYLEDILKNMLKKLEVFVLMFDESHNCSIQTKQVDIHVRFWDPVKSCVGSRFLVSDFLGHGKATDLLPVLIKSVSQFGLDKIIQMSMDGPAVNWKLFKMLSDHIEETFDTRILNIGSCGLHTTHMQLRMESLSQDCMLIKYSKPCTSCSMTPLPGGKITLTSLVLRYFPSNSAVIAGYSTPEKRSKPAQRKALERARKGLPRSPN